MVPPLLYVLVILILSATTDITYINDHPMPYFFFNYHELGWFGIGAGRIGVVYWAILPSALMLAIGYDLLKLNQSFRNHLEEKKRS